MTNEAVGTKRSAASNIAIYAVGNVIRQLAGFIMLPIYTSYLTPGDYGAVGLLVVMVSLFEALIGARFAQAIPKFYYEREDPEARKRLISTALIITSVVSAGSAVLVAMASSSISDVLFGSGAYQVHVALYGTMMFTTAVEVYGLTFMRLQERAVLFVTNSICKLIVQLGLNILLVVHYEMGVMGVVVSAVVASALFGLISGVYIVFYNGVGVSGKLTKRLVIFCWPLWLAGIAGLYIGSSNRVFIRFFADLDQVGLFELAAKFSLILGMLIWNPFLQWWQAERFKIYQYPDQGVAIYPAVFNGLLSVIVLVGAAICLYGDTVVEIMSAPAFHPASMAIPFLIGAAIFGFLNQFLLFSFIVKERTILVAYIRYGAAAVITLFYVLLIPGWGFLGAAASLMLSQIVIFAISYYQAKRCFDQGIRLKFLWLLMGGASAIVMLDMMLTTSTSSWLNSILISSLMLTLVFGLVAALVMKEETLRHWLLSIFRQLRSRHVLAREEKK